MAQFIISAFADEAAADLTNQIAALKRNNLNYIEIRNIDGKCVIDYSEEEINKLKEIISERISDIDGNGENSVLLSTLVFADNAGSEEYDYAIQTKLDLTFTDDCSFIYLMDKANVDAQMQKEVVDQIYDCTDSFIDSSSDKVVKAADGKGYAVNLKDSRLLKDNGIYCDDLYILIRRNYKDDEKNTQAHDDSIAVAEALVK